jgi:hypothetical protein
MRWTIRATRTAVRSSSEAFEKMANLATGVEGRGPHGQVFVRGVERRQALTIHTPLIALTKAQIVRKGIELGVDYGLTSSCYDPSASGEPCGQCDSCLLRRKGFRENGIEDPLLYRASRSVTDEEVSLSSCFPRSQNRDLGHPMVVQNQAVSDLGLKMFCRMSERGPGGRRYILLAFNFSVPGRQPYFWQNELGASS